jgi:hypothetical protein
MPNPLAGALAKLDRADIHLAELDAAVRDYLREEPIRVEDRQEVDGRRRRIQWIATAATDPPAALGLIVGDWANNVRSALDYIVYELVRGETGEDDPRWTHFPVVVAAGDYEGRARSQLRGVPAWSLPVFEGLQPFHDGADARDHHLAILADVSNRDKHRLVHTAAMQIAGSQARVSGTDVLRIYGLEQNPGSIERERLILDALLEVSGDNFRIGLTFDLNVSLEGSEVPIVPLLTWITSEVRDIVEWFAGAFDEDP